MITVSLTCHSITRYLGSDCCVDLYVSLSLNFREHSVILSGLIRMILTVGQSHRVELDGSLVPKLLTRYCRTSQHPLMTPIILWYCQTSQHPLMVPIILRYYQTSQHPFMASTVQWYCQTSHHPLMAPIILWYCQTSQHPLMAPISIYVLGHFTS